MPWRSWSVSQAQATSNSVFIRDHGGHGEGRWSSPCGCGSPSRRVMKRKVGSTVGVEDL